MIINLAMAEPTSYYQMPPVGITETRARVDHVTIKQYTVRCGNRNCWYVGHAPTSEDCNLMLHDHQTGRNTCPQAPARNELPSGYSTIEKLWDELDDVTRAILDQQPWGTGGVVMEGEMLKGYARGIAFTLSMMTHPYFRTVRDITREAVKRYKISKGEIPFEPTPSYRFEPRPSATPPVGEKSAFHGATVPAKPVTRATKTTRAAQRKALEPSKDLAKLDTTKANAIRDAYKAGFFSVEELANMYDVSVMAVKAMCGLSI